MEEFVARVFAGGKVTVPKRLRELFDVKDGIMCVWLWLRFEEE